MLPEGRVRGMQGFLLVWAGQFISILASGMSSFALSIWLFEQTRSATAMGVMQVAYITPFLALSPIAGALVDRYPRKAMMMVSDATAFLATAGILLLQALGLLRPWHLYLAAVLFGLGNTFQWPAYSAAITTMVPKEQYGRANGLLSLMEAGPGVLAPLAAGALWPVVGLTGLLLLDTLTFFLALGALLLVVVPQPPVSEAGRHGQGSLWAEALYGFRYIFARPALLGLQMVFFVGNLFLGMAMAVFTPFVLWRTGDNALALGTLNSASALGSVLGGLLMSLWGGFRRHIHGVLGGWILAGVCLSLFGLGRSLAFWIPVMLLEALVGPVINASNQAIWQAQVAPDVQGRVFAARRLIAWFTQPIAPLLAGVLVDRWLEPLMRSGAGAARWLAPWLGTEAGAGAAALFLFAGLGAALAGLLGYLSPLVREVELT